MFAQAPLQELAEARMVLNRAIDQIVSFFHGAQLKGQPPLIDHHHHPIDYIERALRHRPRDRITNRQNVRQYSTKPRRTLGKSCTLFSMSVIVERETKKCYRFYMVGKRDCVIRA